MLKTIRSIKKRPSERTLTEICSYVGDDGLTHVSLRFRTKQPQRTQIGNSLAFLIAAALKTDFTKEKIHAVVDLIWRQEILGENVVAELRRKEKEEQT